jgi:sigma-E factor negative regulatory protein RseC
MRGSEMQADGVVVGSAAGVARVKVQRNGGCGRCNEEGGCGNTGDSRCDEFIVLNELNVRSGDHVRIDVPEGAALRAALLAYGLPLTGIVLGAGVGSFIGGSDLGSVAGALTGFAFGLACLRAWRHKGAARPRIAEVL